MPSWRRAARHEPRAPARRKTGASVRRKTGAPARRETGAPARREPGAPARGANVPAIVERMSADPPPPLEPSAPAQPPPWLTEAQRKAIHIAFIVLPLDLLNRWLPWPRTLAAWRLVLIAAALTAIAVDLVRIHERRTREWFRSFLGGLLRDHEQFNLLGSTYLIIAALLAIEMFGVRLGGAALGYTVLGDGFAAVAGRAYGRTRVFDKSLEGMAAGLAACLAWGGYLVAMHVVAWPVAVAAALVASLVEILPIPLDDNLGITLFAGYTLKLLGGPV